MNPAGWSNISSIFQHDPQDGYLSLNPHVKGGLFPEPRSLGAERTRTCRAGDMGVESGGHGGRVPRSRKISGGRPPEIMIFQYLFLHIWKFCIFHHFQNKVAEIRGETKFWGRWRLGAYESVPPNKTSWRRSGWRNDSRGGGD